MFNNSAASCTVALSHTASQCETVFRLRASADSISLRTDMQLLQADPIHSQLETLPKMICTTCIPCDLLAPALHKRLKSTQGRCLEAVWGFAAQYWYRIVAKAVVLDAVTRSDTGRVSDDKKLTSESTTAHCRRHTALYLGLNKRCKFPNFKLVLYKLRRRASLLQCFCVTCSHNLVLLQPNKHCR